MSDGEKAIEALELQLGNIEHARRELTIATHRYKHKLIGAEKKIAAAILHIDDAADIVNELTKKVEDEYDDE
jgi:hypothetical protein|nr:MAG TPA: hypothetical protein [Caudoviricetes sp.]